MNSNLGYNNVKRVIPPTVARGCELPINFITEMLRIDIAAAGYMDAHTDLHLNIYIYTS